MFSFQNHKEGKEKTANDFKLKHTNVKLIHSVRNEILFSGKSLNTQVNSMKVR